MSILLAGSPKLPSINELFIGGVLGVVVFQLLIQLVLFALLAFIVFRRKLNMAVLCSAIATAAIGLCWTYFEGPAYNYYQGLFMPKQLVDQLFMVKMAASVLVPALFSGVLVFLIPFFQGKKGRVG